MQPLNENTMAAHAQLARLYRQRDLRQSKLPPFREEYCKSTSEARRTRSVSRAGCDVDEAVPRSKPSKNELVRGAHRAIKASPSSFGAGGSEQERCKAWQPSPSECSRGATL